MHLIDDIDLVFSDLWWNTHLIDQGPNVVDGVVGCSIQLVNIVGALFVKSYARLASVTGFMFRCRFKAIDGLGKMRAQVVLPTPLGPQKR